MNDPDVDEGRLGYGPARLNQYLGWPYDHRGGGSRRRANSRRETNSGSVAATPARTAVGGGGSRHRRRGTRTPRPMARRSSRRRREPSKPALSEHALTGRDHRLHDVDVVPQDFAVVDIYIYSTYRAPTDPVRRNPQSIRPLRSSRRCSRVSDVDRRSRVP